MGDRRSEMEAYYARRAPEFERIYELPERQSGLGALREMLVRSLAGRDVLEVACGTGYWTQPVSRSARSIVATDVNAEVLAVARTKDYGPASVRFLVADAYAAAPVNRAFDGGLAAFWWSHVPIERRKEFLDSMASRMRAGGVLVLCDNTFVAGSSTPIHRRDGRGNTYQLRTLSDGSRYEVVKNYCGAEEMRAILGRRFDGFEHQSLTYYWCATCRFRG